MEITLVFQFLNNYKLKRVFFSTYAVKQCNGSRSLYAEKQILFMDFLLLLLLVEKMRL